MLEVRRQASARAQFNRVGGVVLLSQFLLPARHARCSALWEQLRFWVSCSQCPDLSVSALANPTEVRCLYILVLNHFGGHGSLLLKLCPSLLLGAAQRDTHA